jgi:hypothetical protein
VKESLPDADSYDAQGGFAGDCELGAESCILDNGCRPVDPQRFVKARHKEDHPDTRVGKDVSHRIDTVVAGAIGDEQRVIIRDPHKSRLIPRGDASACPWPLHEASTKHGDSAMKFLQKSSRRSSAFSFAAARGSL